MRIREAKDFLVAQTAEQAAVEGVPLSDLEKRMMYFTEGKDAPEDPTALNDEFEAQYDTTKYEKKIARLMRHVYTRVKTETQKRRSCGIKLFVRSAEAIITFWCCGVTP